MKPDIKNVTQKVCSMHRGNKHKSLVGKPQEKKSCWRQEHRWNNKITADLSEMDGENVNLFITGSSGGLLWKWWWIFRFHKNVIFWQTE